MASASSGSSADPVFSDPDIGISDEALLSSLNFLQSGTAVSQTRTRYASSSGMISISPVARFSLTAPERFSTFPTTATTYSDYEASLPSRISAASVFAFFTYNLNDSGTVSDIYEYESAFITIFLYPSHDCDSLTCIALQSYSAHLWVLFNPCIDSAMIFLLSSMLLYYFYLVTDLRRQSINIPA